MAGNTVKFRAVMDDKVSSSLDKIKDKLALTRKEGAKGVIIGATAAATAKAFQLLDTAISRVSEAVFQSIRDASLLQQSQGAVDSVFGKSADTIEAWGETAATAAGLSKREVNEMAAVTGAQLQGMGFSLEEAAAQAINLQKRAADMAATFGGTTLDAMQAISALMRGERDPIERYGVSIKAVDVNARILALGLDTSTAAAKKNAEAVAGMDLLFEQTAKTQGQFARESDSLAGKQAELGAKMENLSAAIGERLLPAAVAIADAFIHIIDVLDVLNGRMPKTIDAHKDLAVGILEVAASVPVFGANLKPLVAGLDATGSALVDVANDAKNMAYVSDAAFVAMEGSARAQMAAAGKAARDGATAIETIGTAADAAARHTKIGMAAISRALDAIAARFLATAETIIAGYYDPIQTRQELDVLKFEIAEAKKRKAAAKTGREMAEASQELTGLYRREKELQAQLVSQTGVLSKNADKYLDKLQKEYRSSTGKAKASVLALMRALINLRYEANLAAGAIRNIGAGVGDRGGTSGSGYRASGGPVRNPGTYVVGEEGPEKLVLFPGGGGYVIPNTGKMPMGDTWDSGAMRLAGAGGGAPVSLSLAYSPTYSTASVSEAQQFMRAIVPELTRELRRQRLIG